MACELLGVTEVFCSPLPLGKGMVWAAHGQMPVPAPATMRLMEGMVTTPGPRFATGELVTPTGAALVRVLTGMPPLGWAAEGAFAMEHRQGKQTPEGFVLHKVGVGCGSKDFPKHPNILRVLVGSQRAAEAGFSSGNAVEGAPPVSALLASLGARPSAGKPECGWKTEDMVVLETTVDDVSAEALAHLTALLLTHGARDVWTTAASMKKGRLGSVVSALCMPQQREGLLRELFTQSATIGVRQYAVARAGGTHSICVRRTLSLTL